MGALLMCSVGMMTQTTAIIGNYPSLPFEGIMAMIMVVACIGSWLLGVLDTKFGTKLAILISVLVMLLAGIFGVIGSTVTMVIALVLLAIFMGAASNFTVSAAAQYWRREDFPSVFAVVNPIANILQCIGPMMVAMTLNAVGIQMPFIITAVLAAISFVLILCFKPARVKSTDDKYRTTAGKPLDDALVGRK
jgi:MFS family permease